MIKGLTELQNELKAPKNLFNSFGKYAYRNAEAILEAVKPLLAKYKLQQTISDRVVQLGERYYMVATVTLTDGNETLSVEGWARESLEKKGMDDSQISGTASSYARKYALNGMYAIDDTKDADTEEYHAVTTANTKPVASKEKVAAFKSVCQTLGQDPVAIIKKAGWKEGEVLEDHIAKGQAILKKISDEANGNKQTSKS